MKILKLSFKNLNSLRGDFSIDFENGPLAEAGLFAITGPTGAGKTTILDAITLGMFGKAARYDNDRGSPEHVMSRGTGECFAEVTFSCNSGVYTSRWDLARARKKSDGKVQSPKRQLAKGDGEILEEKIKLVDQKVIELTGLDYARFLRSVLLAQGRFKEFLDADGKNRGELLEKITGTEIYSQLSVAAHERAKEAQGGIDDARKLVQGIRLLEEDSIREYKAEEHSLNKKYSENEKRIKSVQESIQRYEQVEALEKEHRLLQERSTRQQVAEDAFGAKAKDVGSFEKARPLMADFASWKLLVKRSESATAEQKSLGLTVQKEAESLRRVLFRTLSYCDQDLAALTKATDEESIALKKGEGLLLDLKKWLEANSKDALLSDSLPGIRDGANECRRLDERLLGSRENLRSVETRRLKLTKDRALQSEHCLGLEKVETLALEESEKCRKNLSTLLEERKPSSWTDVKKEAEQALIQAKELWVAHANYSSESKKMADSQAELAKGKKESLALKEKLSKCLESLKNEQLILEDKETIFRQAAIIASLEDRRKELEDGKPCVLCGATDHPYSSGEMPSKSESEKSLEAQRKRVDAILIEEKALQKDESSLLSSLRSLEKTGADLKARVKAFEDEFTGLTKTLGFSVEIADSEAIKAFGKKARETCGTIDQQIKKIDEAEVRLRSAEKKEIESKSAVKAEKEKLLQLDKLIEEVSKEDAREKNVSKEMEQLLVLARKRFCDSVSKWVSLEEAEFESVKSVRGLEERSSLFSEKKKQEGLYEQRIEALKQTLKRLGEEGRRLNLEKAEWQEKLSKLGDEFEEGYDSSDLPVENVEERRRSCELAMTGRENAETRLESKSKELEALKKEVSAALGVVTVGLEKHGMTSIEELDSVLKLEEKVAQFQIEQRRLNEEKLTVQALLKKNDESKKALAEKEAPRSEDIADLRKGLDEDGKAQKQFAERLGEIRAMLASDTKARVDLKSEVERIETLEKEARPWFVLRDLIGSADGSKFSRFAQGLTLEQLVLHANRHLAELNPRYRIQRVAQADLELEIIDCYEANAVRPTRSLSGGESFLMSLALALGLSELAGRNTKIQSLFIDEGFGSLDGDTLDVALSALENLRLQNRSIGVISHVEDLKVRLSTQVQVKRKTDGHAELLIVDG